MPDPTVLRTFRSDRGDARERLDRVLMRHLADRPDVTRARIQGWIGAGQVRVNGAVAAKPASRLALDDRVEIDLPPPPPRREITAQEMPLAILYEDDYLLALDKPPGIVVHPAPGHHEGTLINALLWRARDWGEGRRPGLINRLDRDTSGVLLAVKTPEIHHALARGLRARGGEEEYLAVVHGAPRFDVGLDAGRIEHNIARDPADRKRRMVSKSEGKESVTLYRVVSAAAANGLALLRCRLVTGRTHQIRVHLQAAGWPIVGDPLYGEPRWKGIADPGVAAACRDFPRQALHARRLAFVHPKTGDRLGFAGPLPGDMAGLLAAAGLASPVG